MNFKLAYTGVPGAVTATLTLDGEFIATTGDLASGKDARKWANKTAAAVKKERAVTPTRRDDVFISVSGQHSFSV